MKTYLEIIAGLLSIEESVTQGQERECREYWVPIARQALKDAGARYGVRDATAEASSEATVRRVSGAPQ